MDAVSTIMNRYSCRDFSDKLPTENDIQTIANAALAAPSGMNRQRWQIVVVTNRELIHELETEGMDNIKALEDKSIYKRILSRSGKLFYDAPLMFIVAIPKDSGSAEMLDCGIITQNITIAAESLGMNSLICGLAAFAFAGAKHDHFAERLGFKEGYDVGMSVLLGYAKAEGGKPHELDKSKLSFVR